MIIGVNTSVGRWPFQAFDANSPRALARLVQETDNVHVDISFVETFDTLATLLRKAPYQRVLFGSHTPFLYTGAVMMKLTRARISKRAAAISHGNAQRLFGV